MNYEELKIDGNIIVAGADENAIQAAELSAGIEFPLDYRSLLRFSDGCLLQNATFVIFFSCGDGFHEKERLAFINNLMQNSEMFFIGRFAGEMFGYLRHSDDRRIYSYFEETSEKKLIANDLSDFYRKYLVAKPKKRGILAALFGGYK